MPKKIVEEEEYEEAEENDEELEAAEQAMYEEPKLQGKVRVAPSAKPAPKAAAPQRYQAPKQNPLLPQTRRYVVYSQQPVVIDSESKEIIAVDAMDALAEIITRLERIEDAIGAVSNQ